MAHSMINILSLAMTVVIEFSSVAALHINIKRLN
ncbi:hypothetical protein swp_4681 [Shewanella piezotolerans WP3]|uniref:Uncharacterized protein n=1 Tax=Shewanella piezotolerans (strain WP3 / JCM 13877) TaxID=225849 RepID=B8CTS3_SHEPW|nr:hypothetical protein swp_4681 [Shewanella piezotolerans WP3]